MNATKFVVLLVIGVVCANVGARQLEGLSKDTKLGVFVPKAATINGFGAELDVYGSTSASTSNVGTASANNGPEGASANGLGSGYTFSDGYVSASGPDATITSSSGVFGQAQGAAEAGPGGAAANGTASGGGSSFVSGSSGPSA